MRSDVHIHRELVKRGLTATVIRDNVALQPRQEPLNLVVLLERLAEAERAVCSPLSPGAREPTGISLVLESIEKGVGLCLLIRG